MIQLRLHLGVFYESLLTHMLGSSLAPASCRGEWSGQLVWCSCVDAEILA